MYQTMSTMSVIPAVDAGVTLPADEEVVYFEHGLRTMLPLILNCSDAVQGFQIRTICRGPLQPFQSQLPHATNSDPLCT